MMVLPNTMDADAVLVWFYRLLPGYNFGDAVILITTTTTVLGLLPLAFGFGEGAEVQQPLALTIIAGLSSSTLLTLGVIPVVYLVLTRLLERRPESSSTGGDAEPLPTPAR